MTDREVALALGSRLIQANYLVAAMKAELIATRDTQGNSLPWWTRLNEIIAGLDHVAEERSEELGHELRACEAKDLLQTLQKFLEKTI